MQTSIPIRDAIRRLKYIARFGQDAGTTMFNSLSDSSSREAEISVPGIRGRICLRRDTSDIGIFEQIFLEQQYAFDLPGFRPQLIIDGGANCGCSSLYFAARFPEAHIVAVEPERSNFDLLERNTAPYERIGTVRAALWHESATVGVVNPGAEHCAFRYSNTVSSEGAVIETVTIAELLDVSGHERIGLLKLDVEGAERELFTHDHESWLSRTDAIIIELHDWLRPGCSRAFYRALSAYDFNQVNLAENTLVWLQRPGFTG